MKFPRNLRSSFLRTDMNGQKLEKINGRQFANERKTIETPLSWSSHRLFIVAIYCLLRPFKNRSKCYGNDGRAPVWTGKRVDRRVGVLNVENFSFPRENVLSFSIPLAIIGGRIFGKNIFCTTFF